MSDQAFDNAKRMRDELLDRKRELQQEIASVDARLDGIETFIADWHTYASGDAAQILGPVNAADRNKPAPAPRTKRPVRGNSRKEEVAEAALEIIRERGEPVMRSELYRALIERGFRIEGGDPEMVLSTMLWRMKHRIVRHKSGGYWPAEEANPEAEQAPEDNTGRNVADANGPN